MKSKNYFKYLKHLGLRILHVLLIVSFFASAFSIPQSEVFHRTNFSGKWIAARTLDLNFSAVESQKPPPQGKIRFISYAVIAVESFSFHFEGKKEKGDSFSSESIPQFLFSILYTHTITSRLS
jgi:hypothetical protein